MKNRVFLPKRFQDGLERKRGKAAAAILTRGFEGCLFLFSESGFERVLERLRTRAFEGPEARLMQRLFFSATQRVDLDSQGRLLIPEKLKALAGIDKEVAMIGVIDRIEIWPVEIWRGLEARHGADFDRLGGVLTGDEPAANAPGERG